MSRQRISPSALAGAVTVATEPRGESSLGLVPLVDQATCQPAGARSVNVRPARLTSGAATATGSEVITRSSMVAANSPGPPVLSQANMIC